MNCVNFAITGRINPTNKKLKSIDTLDRGNNYYLQYFDGRISEVDKDYASTRIVFMLGNKRIEVVRNFFPDNSILEYKLDIVTFVCSKTTASTSMLIDTPEGSLDIAYETNAGSMFYEYIAANQKMIITANLNSSGLIQTLAGKTKFEKFVL